MISNEETARIQEELGHLAIAAVRIDLDGFLEVTEGVGSPQALAAGIAPAVVTSAGKWTELARLLKPFRDAAVERLETIRQEVIDPHDLVSIEVACPSCGERRVDELAIGDDDEVLCSACGRRYQLPKAAC